MHILIFEPRLSGHHGQYLKFIIRAAKKTTKNITLVTSAQIFDMPEYKLHLEEECEGIQVLAIEKTGKYSGIKQDIYHYKLLRKQILSSGANIVWIPYADRVAQIAGLMRLFKVNLAPADRGVSVTALLFRGAAAYGWNSRLGTLKDKISLKLATFAPFNKLYTVDNVLFEHMIEGNVQHCHLMPEPVESSNCENSKNKVMELLDLADDAESRYIVSLGAQNKRKGADLLVNAFMQADLRDTDFLILAGQLDISIKNLLDGYRNHPSVKQIIVRDALLSVKQIQLYLELADFVAVPYPEHIGSSSFVIRACVAKKPLIASDAGWIGLTTQRYSLGLTCNVKDVDSLANAITESLTSSGEIAVSSRDFGSLADFHTVENFMQTWLDSLSRDNQTVL